MGGKTSNESKTKYNSKAYDRLAVNVKKGQRQLILGYAEAKGLSLNGYINRLIAADMGDALTVPDK
jgi:hypothetical protein